MLRRLMRSFSQRRDVMLEAVRAEGLTIAGETDAGGSSLWMRTPPGISATELAKSLLDDSVLIEPGRPFYADWQEGDQYYRIAYSSITAERIPEGIARIARRLR